MRRLSLSRLPNWRRSMAEDLITCGGVGSWWCDCSTDGFMISAPLSCSSQHANLSNVSGGSWNSAAVDIFDEAHFSFGCDESPLHDLTQEDMSLDFEAHQQVSQPETDHQSTVQLDGSHQILVSVIGNGFQGNMDSAALEGFPFPELHEELQQQPVDADKCRASVAKFSGETEPALNKKARIETPSPLPTFKVRKEKLGDRITALQQLVSPFGKTDTASVLHETIDYVKFLHDQLRVLSAPNLKNYHHFRQQNKEDLTSRGLCLVPVSATFALVTAIESDSWNPFR